MKCSHGRKILGCGSNLSMGLKRILIAEHNIRIFINTFLKVLNLSKCLVPFFFLKKKKTCCLSTKSDLLIRRFI